MGFYQYARLAFFSKESSDRQLFRTIKSQRALRIVELGVGSLDRTVKMLTLATDCSKRSRVQYTGFDAFDERDESLPELSLIAAHRELTRTEASIRLVPGGPISGLSALANTLQDTDLVLVSHAVTDALLAPVWFYLPRMCHPGTRVLRQGPGAGETADWDSIPLDEVNRRATERPTRIAA